MFGRNRFRYAESNQNQTTCQETDNHHFLFLEALETEEWNLRVQQIATYQ